MSDKEISKTEAARRQIDAAISMLFRNDDPLAVHTVAMAAFRILRDLAKSHGLKHTLDSMIRPGMEGEFWVGFNNAANFLKHADQDPNGVLGPFSEDTNDQLLVIACTYYELLGNRWTLEMGVLMFWYMSLHPDSLSKSVDPAIAGLLDSESDIQLLPRSGQLASGLKCLQWAREQPWVPGYAERVT